MKVYRYGLLPPVEGAGRVAEQMRFGHKYYNTLIEIERGRRAAVREATNAVGDLPTLLAEESGVAETVEGVLDLIKKAKARERTRKVNPALATALKAERARLKEVREKIKAVRTAQRDNENLQAELARIEDLAAGLARNARAYCDVYWCSYLQIEAAVDAARNDTALYDDPHFRRWRGEGAVAVQLQGGLGVADVFGNDTQVRVDPVDPSAWTDPSRGVRRRLSRTVLHLRVGSNGRNPIWAAWPMLMHRPLPEGATVKWVTVQCRKIGPREEWVALFTVDEGAAPELHANRVAVAVDVGWRVVQGGIRVARWRAEDGAEGEVRLDDELVSAIRYADVLRSIRDRAFDAERARLGAGLAALPEVPEWLRTRAATLASWKSPARLAALATEWTGKRFAGDEHLVGVRETRDPTTKAVVTPHQGLAGWAAHDRHLWEWESSQRRKTLRRRQDFYRVTAATLTRRYGVLVVEKFNKQEVARRPRPEDETADNATARANRQLAAPSELVQALTQACLARGGTVVVVPAENTTRECHACGCVDHWDQALHLWHACTQCGHVWDQDQNACHNLLARYQALVAKGLVVYGPKEGTKKGKWAKRKEEKNGGAQPE